MKKMLLNLVGLSFVFVMQVQASPINEFESLKKTISQWSPDGIVGGLYLEKNFGDHVVLWKFENGPQSSEVIRIYRAKNTILGDAFSVTYYKNTMIVPGQMVLRRFVGTEPTGWKNETYDYKTGAFLGTQGLENPTMTARDAEIMKLWSIIK